MKLSNLEDFEAGGNSIVGSAQSIAAIFKVSSSPNTIVKLGVLKADVICIDSKIFLLIALINTRKCPSYGAFI